MSINIASEIVHFAGRIADSPAPAAVPISRCIVFSALGCVPCLAWSALVFARPGSGTACPAACVVQPVRVRWGWGLHLGGMGPETRVEAVSPVSSDQNKKALSLPTPALPSQTKTHLIVQVSKNSEKYKKVPLPV